MSITDMAMSVIPEKFRRDATVLAIGGALAAGGVTLNGKIDTAYAAAKTTQSLEEQVRDLKTRQLIMEGQSATTQSNVQATKYEVDMLVQHMLNQEPLPTAPAVSSTVPKK
jgi:hypothetical protein